MAVDYFLQIDGIKGESQDSKHKDTIEILSFSWGASNTGSTASGGGGGAGKVSFQDFTIMKQVDKASPLLMLNCASGQHIKKAVLYVRKQGGEQMEYYTVTMEDLVVTLFTSSGGQPGVTSPVPQDQCSFSFSKINFEYKPQKADGTADSAVTAGWDVKGNKKT